MDMVNLYAQRKSATHAEDDPDAITRDKKSMIDLDALAYSR